MPDEAETFSVMEGESEGYPVVAMVSSRLQGYEKKQSAPWFLSLSTRLLEATPQGLPTANEAEALNQWEDTIEKEISSRSKFFFVGRVTWKGHRELLYYVQKPKEVAEAIQNLIDRYAVRTCTFRYEQDKDWRNVSIYLR